MPVIPTQVRAVDPFDETRWSQIANRYTRMITNGNNVVLYPDNTFNVTRTNWKTLTVSGGTAIIKDILINITDTAYSIDMTDPSFYVDSKFVGAPTGFTIDTTSGSGVLDSTSVGAEFYLVVDYDYRRTLPVNKAYYKIIRNVDAYFTPNPNDYLFLAAITISYSYVDMRFEIEDSPFSINYTSLIIPEHTRNYSESPLVYTADGGSF